MKSNICFEITDPTAGPSEAVAGSSVGLTEPVTGRLWWLVAIYERLNGHLPFSCAGVLIHPSVVLTSAGCFSRGTDPDQFAITVAPVHGQPQKNAEDVTTIISAVWFPKTALKFMFMGTKC